MLLLSLIWEVDGVGILFLSISFRLGVGSCGYIFFWFVILLFLSRPSWRSDFLELTKSGKFEVYTFYESLKGSTIVILFLFFIFSLEEYLECEGTLQNHFLFLDNNNNQALVPKFLGSAIDPSQNSQGRLHVFFYAILSYMKSYFFFISKFH